MRKLLFTGILFLTVAVSSTLQAQSISNRSWKSYIDDPINDSIILHIYGDSSTVTNLQGAVFLRIECTIQHDTLKVVDKRDDDRGCPDSVGLYKIQQEENSFTLILIDDTCDGRATALTNRKWLAMMK